MSSGRPVVVLDPGHGGVRPAGGSSPNNAVGPDGQLEKTVVLDVARRLADRLGDVVDVRLTRTDDDNLPLAARARLARDSEAAVFISLHLNGSPDPAIDGTEVWVARQAADRSLAFARDLGIAVAAAAGVPNRGIRTRDLGVLLPGRHAPRTTACLVEIAFLSNAERARRFGSAAYRNALAEALGAPIRRLVADAPPSTAHSRNAAETLQSAPPTDLGVATVGSVRLTVSVPPTGTERATSLEDALRLALGRVGQSAAVQGPLYTAGAAEVARWTPAGALPSPLPPVIDCEARGNLCCVVLAGATETATYFPAVRAGQNTPPAERRRWVKIPHLSDFYGLPATVQATHRARWIGSVQRGGTGLTKEQIRGLSTPVLRLLLAQNAARIFPVETVRRGTPPTDRGGVVNGVTVPLPILPVAEPDCYLPVIGEREGRLESINAWDAEAGLSLGPLQFNVRPAAGTNEGALFRFLWRLFTDDRVLFDQAFGALGWQMRFDPAGALPTDADHVVLRIRAGTPREDSLRGTGTPADIQRNFRYFQSGVAGQAGIDPAFRRDLAGRFRAVVVWPHVQEMILATSAWWLQPGLAQIRAAGIPTLDARAPDRDTFVLTALLLSAFVRFSGCLRPLLDALAQWPTPAAKLLHWRQALATLRAPCPELPTRLAAQETDGRAIHNGLEAIRRAHATGTAQSVDESLDVGDRSVLTDQALETCVERLRQLSAAASRPDSVNRRAADRIRTQTGISVDANPYVGITRAELDAVIRAARSGTQMPEVLLALWAKEGSTRMVTPARAVPQASTAANARTLFRCRVFYEDLGTDHFMVTTRRPGQDNVWDSTDRAAPDHQRRFGERVRALVQSGHLSSDVMTDIDSELAVAREGTGPFSVRPSTRFYALALALADAYFSALQARRYPEISVITPELNYLQWNMGTTSFAEFLRSADRHRREPRHQVGGQPISIETWALHTVPATSEYQAARRNAVRFVHYVECYRPIFAAAINAIKPGIDDLPRLYSRIAQAEPEPVVYQTQTQYQPSTDTTIFRCAPDPLSIPATRLPTHGASAGDAARGALRELGANATELATFDRAGGLAPLRPIAEFFGAGALVELLARLRYPKAWLLSPPHTHGTALKATLGVQAPVLLAARVLLAIPGHFRELARRAPTADEAFALENLGWQLCYSLRDEVASRSGKRWWLPPAPAWAGPFANPLPALSAPVMAVIRRSLLIDTTLASSDYQGRARQWREGLAGQLWRRETSTGSNGHSPGRPWYADLLSVNTPSLTAERRVIDQAWAAYRARVETQHGPSSEAATQALNGACHNGEVPRDYTDARGRRVRLFGSASLGGIKLATAFPILEPPSSQPAREITTAFTILAPLVPLVEQLFAALAQLGWNDLLFHTAGAFCIRGVRLGSTVTAERRRAAARNLSNHGYATAMDLLVFENPQGSNRSTHDRRIVALFEHFGFRWGRCFNPPDPHHFEFA